MEDIYEIKTAMQGEYCVTNDKHTGLATYGLIDCIGVVCIGSSGKRLIAHLDMDAINQSYIKDNNIKNINHPEIPIAYIKKYVEKNVDIIKAQFSPNEKITVTLVAGSDHQYPEKTIEAYTDKLQNGEISLNDYSKVVNEYNLKKNQYKKELSDIVNSYNSEFKSKGFDVKPTEYLTETNNAILVKPDGSIDLNFSYGSLDNKVASIGSRELYNLGINSILKQNPILRPAISENAENEIKKELKEAVKILVASNTTTKKEDEILQKLSEICSDKNFPALKNFTNLKGLMNHLNLEGDQSNDIMPYLYDIKPSVPENLTDKFNSLYPAK